MKSKPALPLDPLRPDLRLVERLVDGSTAGVLVVDKDLRCAYWNANMEAMTGLGAREVIGTAAGQAFPVLAGDEETARMRAALAGATGRSPEVAYAIDGTRREGFCAMTFVPLEPRGDESSLAVVIVRDVTDQRAGATALRETEARFTHMANASPVLLWMAGLDSLCNFFNQSWLDFTGRTLEEEWGVGWAEGIYFEDFQRCMDTYIAAFNERRRFEMEYRLRRHDGEYRWILDRGAPRYAPDGTFAGYIGSCVDITEIKRLEGELRKAVRDRDDFLTVASHELRTPLTTLQLQIDSLARTVRERPEEGIASGRILRNTATAQTQVLRAVALIDELLEVSRITVGKLEIARAQTDLVALTRHVVDRMAPAAKVASCVVSVDADGVVSGEWDSARIDRLLTNLLSNAIKYGRGAPIELRVAPEEGAVKIVVRDHGIGIASTDQPRIFERFQRAVSADNYSGFGLGLWIAREIVTAHGGSIAVESDIGRGATFTVSLPLAAGGQ